MASRTLAIALLFHMCLAHPIYEEVNAKKSISPGELCTSAGPLGMESGAIPDSSITASGIFSSSYIPSNARLGGSKWWIPPVNQPAGQWIQVDMGEYTSITGVIMQGYSTNRYSVKTISIEYSLTGESDGWQSLADEEGETIQLKAHDGSADPWTVTFPMLIMARFLRIRPTTWFPQNYYNMRLEILGCRVLNGTIRLVNGDDQWSGQVEIFRHGGWGAVCDSKWDLKDATTVCHQLGFGRAIEAKNSSFFGENELPIVMNHVACKGTENRLADCPFACTSSHQCESSYVAGVVCKPRPDAARLVGGSNPRSGRFEMYRNDSWGSFCDTDWDITDATVACRQLGFSGAEEAKSDAHFGQGQGPVLMDGLACDGSESKITDCPSFCWEEKTKCNHTQDAGVVCLDGESDVV